MKGFVSASSLRLAKIIGSAHDVWGDKWDVRERRKTPFDFDVLLGWPHSIPRGRGGSGGVKVIVTPDLAGWLNALRGSRAPNALPIGGTALKRIRRLLGYHASIDRADWWEARADGLATLTTNQFAARHHTSTGAVSQARIALFGRRVRPAFWWAEEQAATAILSDRPCADNADEIGVSVGSVRRLRSVLHSASPETTKRPALRMESGPVVGFGDHAAQTSTEIEH